MSPFARSRKSLCTVVGMAALLLSAACAPKAATVDTDAIAKQLTQLDDDWSKAAATKNADAVASFYAADAIAYPPNMPIAIGQAAARAVWAGGFADSTYTISWKTDHAGVSKSGDLGYTSGAFEESMRGADGVMVTAKGKYLCTWALQADGSWKAIHDMWNYDAK